MGYEKNLIPQIQFKFFQSIMLFLKVTIHP